MLGKWAFLSVPATQHSRLNLRLNYIGTESLKGSSSVRGASVEQVSYKFFTVIKVTLYRRQKSKSCLLTIQRVAFYSYCCA